MFRCKLTFAALFAGAALLSAAPVQNAKPQSGRPEATAKPAEAKPAAKGLKIGDKVDGAIKLTDIDGKTWTLGDFRKAEGREGKVVVIDFWSINCPVSKGYEERMKKLAALCKEKGAEFLAINANHNEVSEGQDPYKQIRAYTKEAGVAFPILIDRGNAVADTFGAKTTPHIFILDREGVLQYMGAPDNDEKGSLASEGGKVENYAADAVTALVAGKTPEKSSTKPVGCSIKRAAPAAQ